MKTVSFYTLGCKVNTYETAAMGKIFQDNGYKIISYNDDVNAEVYVINTCTVTNIGDKKSRQIIRRFIRKAPLSVIVAVGCYAQVSPKEIEKINGVSIILGTQYRGEILKYVDQYKRTKKLIVKVDNILRRKHFENLDVNDFYSNTRAFIKIQEGCNNFCTFCIIPFARGKIRSRDPYNIISQIKTLTNKGYKEVVLTGIHTAGYGEDLKDYNFAKLLFDICKFIPELPRIRISSIEASQITDEVLNVIKNNNKIVNHLHIPLQSGCDTVLRRMSRKYLTQYFYNTIILLRSISPDISITTDLIVGFPGETSEEFVQTYDFCKKIQFSEIHVFPYSIRKKTPAARMKNQIDSKIKSARVAKIIDLSNTLAKKYAKRFVNNILSVLVESKTDSNIYTGYTENYLKVKFNSSRNCLNEIVKVKIIKSDYPFNLGILIE